MARGYNGYPQCQVIDTRGEVCGQGHYAKGLCENRYAQFMTGFTIDHPLRHRKFTAARAYNAAHIRVRRNRGSGFLYVGKQRGTTAAHWALQRDALPCRAELIHGQASLGTGLAIGEGTGSSVKLGTGTLRSALQQTTTRENNNE